MIQNGRFVEVSANGAAVEAPDNGIAIRYKKLGRPKYGLLDDALLKLAGTRKVKLAFTDSLPQAGLIATGHGHAGTVQEHFKIIRGGKLIQRPRVWSIDARELKAFIRKSKQAD